MEAAEKFPWKKTREQALQLGWQASGVGEGAWRRHDASDAA
ncbi:hypothetical protein MNBD_GAMMA22-1610 [hydrothermal vent metagenome]|uniref:Uncharacterized protein n=1 Tax=hydrothermal vent metagenome TaxID=652676 RepID=A0A3B1A4R1_9ZZZZ